MDDGRSWCIILSVLFLALSFFGSLAATAIPEANDATLREREEKGSSVRILMAAPNSSAEQLISAVNGLLEFLDRRDLQLIGQLDTGEEIQPELTRAEYLRLLKAAKDRPQLMYKSSRNLGHTRHFFSI